MRFCCLLFYHSAADLKRCFFPPFRRCGVLSWRTKGAGRVVVYWDLTAGFNLLTDYLLLRTAQRLAGREQSAARLWLAAALGAGYAVVRAAVPLGPAGTAAALVLVGAVAFAGTGRAVKLTALFTALSCALGGAVMALGAATGSAVRLARGIVTAQLPWGVFAAAGGACYLLMGVCMRGGARIDGARLVRVTLRRGGKNLTLTLLRDSGNTLCDAQTGQGVIVVGESAVRSLLPREEEAFSQLGFAAVGTPCGALRSFLCDGVRADGRELGARRVAVAPGLFGDGGYQGLMPAEKEGDDEGR